jgi:hypothetical protein
MIITLYENYITNSKRLLAMDFLTGGGGIVQNKQRTAPTTRNTSTMDLAHLPR